MNRIELTEAQQEYEKSFYISENNKDFVISDYKNGVCLNEYIGSNSTIRIPDEIDGKHVIKIGIRFEETYDEVSTVGALQTHDRTAIYIGKNVKEIDSISFSRWDDYNVYDYCEPLTSIEVDKDNPYYSSENGILYNKSKDMLLCVPYGMQVDTLTIGKEINHIAYGAIPNDITIKGYKGTAAEEYAKEWDLTFIALE